MQTCKYLLDSLNNLESVTLNGNAKLTKTSFDYLIQNEFVQNDETKGLFEKK